ncbi:DUF3515 domain-containing protein [Kribbella deserti]|uniref:DUF3515 domain-containing protein n=1 Tax=Kribbella deserti TaxID=1926257 RepID=A0ABV6QV02_9ACTN
MPGGAHLKAHPRRLVPALGLSLLLLGAAACSPGPVGIAVPTPAPEVASACASLINALPERITEGERRETDPVSPLTRAYGDPPIELTCGVAPPAGMAEAASQCFEVNGVGWYAQEAENGVIFTTIGRKLYLEMAVPNAYSPEANVLTDVAPAIKSQNPVITPCT